MDLYALWQQTLASTLTTTAEDGATAFGLHAGTEAKLAFARALGWLVGALHVVKKSLRAGQDVQKQCLCQWEHLRNVIWVLMERIKPLGRGAMKFAKGKARRATQLFGRKVSFNRVVENARLDEECQLMI